MTVSDSVKPWSPAKKNGHSVVQIRMQNIQVGQLKFGTLL